MPTFIELKEDDRILLFIGLKNKLNLYWREVYPMFNISKASFFNYLAGRYPIPEELFNNWKDITKMKIQDIKKIERPRYEENAIPKIKLDKNLAEIIGIINGDGHISKNKKEICVVGSILEADYYNYMKNLFEKKFGLNFTLKKKDTTHRLRVYSKNLIKFLIKEYNLPSGNKMNKLKIPNQILKNKILLKSYIKGLYDTDGCFHVRRGKDPMLVITSADSRYLVQIKKGLMWLDFKVSRGDQRIFIYRRRDVHKFFKEIKPANSKHLKKYQSFSKLQTRG